MWRVCGTITKHAAGFGLAGPPVGLVLVVGFIGAISIADAVDVRAVWPIGEVIRTLPDVIALLPAAYEWGLFPALATGASMGVSAMAPCSHRQWRRVRCAAIATLPGAGSTALWLVLRGEVSTLWFLIVIGAITASAMTAMTAMSAELAERGKPSNAP